MSNKPKSGVKEFSKEKDIFRAINYLKSRNILVGIPSFSPKNRRDDTAKITNAQIGYINEYGSPARNIPARPFLIPSIKEQQDVISSKLKAAGKAAAAGDIAEIEKIYQGLALSVPSGVQEYILRGLQPPLANVTLRLRHLSRLTKSQRDAEIEELMRRAGIETNRFKDTPTDRLNLPLVNTGQLLRSIEGFVRGKK